MTECLCFNCQGYRPPTTHYFCFNCYIFLLYSYEVRIDDLEEYINASYEGEWEFKFSRSLSIFAGYDFIRMLIPTIKPITYISEYILLWKLLRCKAYYEFRYRIAQHWRST